MTPVVVGGLSSKRGEKIFGHIPLGELPDGTPLTIPIILIGGVKEGPTLLLVGGTHGDELTGIEAVKRIASEIEPAKVAGVILAVPVLNVPSFICRNRFWSLELPPGPLDLNRVFPGKADGYLTERVAHIAMEELIAKADYIVELHTATWDGVMYPHPDLVPDTMNVPDELRRKVEEMSRAFGSLVVTKPSKVHYPGALFLSALSKGKPILTVDGGVALRVNEEYISSYIKSLHNVIKYLRMMEGKPEECAEQTVIRDYLTLRVNRGGVLKVHVKPGQPLTKGQLVAEVTNLFNQVVDQLRAPADGIAMRIQEVCIVATGDRALTMGTY